MIIMIDVLLTFCLILTKELHKCSSPACALQEMPHFTDTNCLPCRVAETGVQFPRSLHASLHSYRDDKDKPYASLSCAVVYRKSEQQYLHVLLFYSEIYIRHQLTFKCFHLEPIQNILCPYKPSTSTPYYFNLTVILTPIYDPRRIFRFSFSNPKSAILI